MEKIFLEVTGKSRNIDDTVNRDQPDEGIVYKLTLQEKSGKKGEPGYKSWKLVIEEGTPILYKKYEPKDEVLVSIELPQKKLGDFP